MAEPDYMVIRPAADLPDGFLPDGMDGKWFDRSQLPKGPGDGHATTARMGGAVAVATGRFETREDGAVAEVYEVRP
ncbi:hypothetical protein [Actinomadura madurae]|uniref:hypothetical protein n=1 Tax=Actinomadura madurae TaxID=1993 RepID=UPI0020D25E61|nr:hypothetical protein [Actinomadura madurae]MCP9947353.1 hypothetical protein [Actinomadura madurae]MCP9964119.1 hypothetical protein [Actinomadura madurae]MCP9976591.1 hypothetical protein [Actinomadura madurae]MCQ0011912.1 hypothetical protein [Actinomadura madurae]